MYYIQNKPDKFKRKNILLRINGIAPSKEFMVEAQGMH